MNEVYNLRVGDMLFNDRCYRGDKEESANIVAVIYKMTPKYAYYATCARNHGNPNGDHFVTLGNKTKKEQIYKSVRDGRIGISYASGTKHRRKIEDFS